MQFFHRDFKFPTKRRRDFIQFSASKGPRPRHAWDPDSAVPASQWLPAAAPALPATTHPRQSEGDAICMNKAGRPICSFHLLCAKLSCQRARIQNSAIILRLHRLLASLPRSFEPKCTFSPPITCFTPNYRSSPNPKWAAGREEAGYRVQTGDGKEASARPSEGREWCFQSLTGKERAGGTAQYTCRPMGGILRTDRASIPQPGR